MAMADDHPLAALDTPSSFDELVKWMDKVDVQTLKTERAPSETKDYLSKLGFIIRASCFKGNRELRREKIIAHYEAAIQHMLRQTSRCYKLFRLTPLPSVPSIVKVLDIRCSDQKPNVTAAATVLGKQPPTWAPSRAVFSPTYFLSASQGIYQIEVSDWGNSDLSLTTADLAATFMHEIAHLTPANNRVWHSDTKSKSKTECQNSIFEDRIFFTEALCVPRGFYGKLLYGDEGDTFPLKECKNLCAKALADVDDIDDFIKAKPTRKNIHKFEEKYLAKPMNKDDVKITCDQVRSVTRFVAARRKDTTVNRLRHKTYAQFHALTKAEKDAPDLSEKYEKFFQLARMPVPYKESLEELTSLKSALEFRLVELGHEEPFASAFKQAYVRVKNMSNEQVAFLELIESSDRH